MIFAREGSLLESLTSYFSFESLLGSLRFSGCWGCWEVRGFCLSGLWEDEAMKPESGSDEAMNLMTIRCFVVSASFC